MSVGHGCPNNIERLETGLPSFGSDMDYSHTPLQCGFDRYCQLDTDLQSMSIAALREQRAQGVKTRLVGVVAPKVPAESRYRQLLADGRPVGDITSQTLSGRYDAWLAFAYLESELIDRLKNKSVELQLLCNNEPYAALFSELPFKLDKMGLDESFPNL